MTEKKKVSFSQFSFWANCHYAWKLKYVDGHTIDGGNINSLFGTAMHETIQSWLNTLYNGSPVVAKSMELDDLLMENMKKAFIKNIVESPDGKKVVPCTREELEEFYHQGNEILRYLQKHSKKFFPTEDVKLFAIEYPVEVDVRPNIVFNGYIDIITHDTAENVYTIYDLKTSKSGWKSYQKNDPVKTSQLLLYKKFFAETMNIPLNSINVEYVILKRELYESQFYETSRISTFVPSNGPPSIKKSWALFSEFLDKAFLPNGEHSTAHIEAASTESACKFCVYRDRPDLCEFAIT